MRRRLFLQAVICILCSAVLIATTLPLSVAGAVPTFADTSMLEMKLSVPASTTTDGEFPLKVTYVLPDDSTWTSLGVRIKDSTGKTVLYESIWIGTETAGTHEYEFSISLAKYNLQPDVYTVEAEGSTKIDSSTLKGTAKRFLPLYQQGKAATSLTYLARVETTLFRNAKGECTQDPTKYLDTLESIQNYCAAVNKDRRIQTSIVIAPAMLEEWDALSNGYTLLVDGKPQKIEKTSAISQAYASTLSSLQNAASTGRLSMIGVGYADPDLSALKGAVLEDDISIQYEYGAGITESLVSTITAQGTVPFHLALPQEAIPVLQEQEIPWAVVGDNFARSQETTATSGAWKIEWSPSFSVLVNDSAATQAITNNDSSGFLKKLMGRNSSPKKSAAQPMVVVSNIVDAKTGKAALSMLNRAAAQPWVKLISPDAAAASAKEEVTLFEPDAPASPAGFWDTVYEARHKAVALDTITEAGEPTSVDASRASLLAESSAWSRLDNSWTSEAEGLAYANNAKRVVDNVLSKITLKIEPVTLAKDEGEIPLVVSNGTILTLDVGVVPVAEEGLAVLDSKPTTLKLRPSDNYTTIPVKLENSSPGKLLVKIMANDEIIAEQSVVVKGSLVDRAFLLGGIAICLLGILWYIRRRVRSVEATDRNSDLGHAG